MTKSNQIYSLMIVYIILLMVYAKTGNKNWFYAAGGTFIFTVLKAMKQNTTNPQ